MHQDNVSIFQPLGLGMTAKLSIVPFHMQVVEKTPSKFKTW